MTAKKKTLIELMLDAGIKPEYLCDMTEFIVCDSTGENAYRINEYRNRPKFKVDTQEWYSDGLVSFNLDVEYSCKNWKRTIVTRQQFIDAYNERNNQKEILQPVPAQHPEMTGKTNIAEVKSTEDIEPCKHVNSSAYDVCNNETSTTCISLSFEDVGSNPSDAATAIQPNPHGKSKPILGMVLADLTNRALEGKEKYGEPLKAGNGRNALWDAYQEALDLSMYLRQAIEEQGSK